jgi:hypothetical protein
MMKNIARMMKNEKIIKKCEYMSERKGEYMNEYTGEHVGSPLRDDNILNTKMIFHKWYNGLKP